MNEAERAAARREEMADWMDRAPDELRDDPHTWSEGWNARYPEGRRSRGIENTLDMLDAPPPGDNGVGHGHDGEPDASELLESWPPLDLGPALRGELETVTPSILRRDDGRGLLYAGRVNGVHGDSGIGKSWVGAIAAAQLLNAGACVIWVDFEDPGPAMLVERLRIIGIDDATIADRLLYHGPVEFFSSEAVALIIGEAQSHGAELVVIDSLGEAFGLEGVDENADKEVAPWFRRVCRRIADAGPAVLPLDHSTKAADNPLHPSGSKRKRAAITGASYLLDAPSPLTREHGGRLRLTCAKDRHGHYRRGDVVAEIEFTTYPDGGMTVHVWPPAKATRDTPNARLHIIARAVVRAVKDADRAVTKNELVALMNVRAAATIKRAGIDYAIAAHAIRVEAGGRGAQLHHYVRDLPDPDDDA